MYLDSDAVGQVEYKVVMNTSQPIDLLINDDHSSDSINLRIQVIESVCILLIC